MFTQIIFLSENFLEQDAYGNLDNSIENATILNKLTLGLFQKECKGDIPPSLGDIPELHSESSSKLQHHYEECPFLNRDAGHQI